MCLILNFGRQQEAFLMRNNLLLVATFSATLAIFASACGSKQERLTRVTVTGEAKAQAQPDTAVIVLSVVTQNKQALNAQQENARKSEAVINAVKQTAGVNPEIRTSDYSLQPQYNYQDSRLPTIIGYEARNSVTVMMGDLNNVGAVVDAASQAGANSVQGVSFTLRENNQARSQTLDAATRQAMSKAQAIAQALGGRIVRVVEEHEGAVNRTPGTADEQANAMNSNTSVYTDARNVPSTPVEAGTLNVRTEVQLIVEIEVKP
jgi:uncharacterized protein YggE